MGSCVPVSNRIKILKVNSFEEAENKVNDFLAFDKDIAYLNHIDYRLEFNFVIIEYYVMIEEQENKNNNNNNNRPLSVMDISYAYTPFNEWLKLYFPFCYYYP
jgi:hypothetical protein